MKVSIVGKEEEYFTHVVSTTTWWEKDGLRQFGGSSYTDRPTRVVVYPRYRLGEDVSGVLMVVYNWRATSPH